MLSIKKIIQLWICFCAFMMLNTTITAQSSIESEYLVIDSSNLIVNYMLTYFPDSTDIFNKKNEEFQLFIGNNVSKFISKNLQLILEALKSIHDQAQLNSWLSDPSNKPPSPGFRYKIYKKYPAGMVTYIERIPSSTFRYEEDINTFSWKLHDVVDTLLCYKVQKATTSYGGRNWIAWFCPEIPYNDGPYKFCGLPGLILKLYDTNNHYAFEITSIETLNEYIAIELPDATFINTTREGFLQAKKNFKNDIINRAKEAGLGHEAQQTAARNLQKRNNPIELR